MHHDAREWMGIEPTRSRVSDPSTALKAAEPTRRPDTPDIRVAYQAYHAPIRTPTHTGDKVAVSRQPSAASRSECATRRLMGLV